jgi:hypothetical protein
VQGTLRDGLEWVAMGQGRPAGRAGKSWEGELGSKGEDELGSAICCIDEIAC